MARSKFACRIARSASAFALVGMDLLTRRRVWPLPGGVSDHLDYATLVANRPQSATGPLVPSPDPPLFVWTVCDAARPLGLLFTLQQIQEQNPAGLWANDVKPRHMQRG